MTFLVPPWDRRTAGTLHPSMTIGSTAAPSVALAAVAEGLTSTGFRIRYAGTEELTARFFGWRFAGWRRLFKNLATVNDFPLVLLDLEAWVTDEGVRVRVLSQRGGRDGSRHASDGLTRCVARLRTQGFEVTTTPWGKA